MCEIGGAKVWRSELEARVALNDYDAAISLAQGMIIKEERLQSLAVIVKAKCQKGLTPEPELIDLIKTLYSQIDVASLAERAPDIASDLLFAEPSLAVDLLEKATSTVKEEGSLDWAFAKLSMTANIGVGNESIEKSMFKKINEKIIDPSIKKLSSVTSILFGDYDYYQIIDEIKKLDKASDQIGFINLWLRINKEKKEIIPDIIEYAIDLVLRTTELSPDARLLRHLTKPLQFLSEIDRSNKLIGLFEGLLKSTERLGPTLDYVKIQLDLASAEVRFDLEAARNRVVEVVLYSSEILDLDIKAAALANIDTVLKKIDPQKKFQERDMLHSYTYEELNKCIESLLSQTANQFSGTRSILKALSGGDYLHAAELSARLNTEDRRNNAFNETIVSYLSKAENNIDLVFIDSTLNKITDDIIYNDTLIKICKEIPKNIELGKWSVKTIKSEVMRIRYIRDPKDRCELYCKIIPFLINYKKDELSDFIETLLQYFDSDWEAIDTGWDRIDIGCQIASSLAETCESIAREYLNKSEELKSEIFISSETTAFAYITCINIVTRCFTGLLHKTLYNEDDLVRIEELISHVPSYSYQAILWGSLAVRCYGKGKGELCKKIVTKYVRSNLEKIIDKKSLYYQRVILTLSPALYFAHKNTAFDDIDKICDPLKNSAYSDICEAIKTRINSNDAYENRANKEYTLDYAETIDLCELISKLTKDSSIYYQIRDICFYLMSKKSRYNITEPQKNDIVRKLSSIIETKLPDKKNIAHEGYKILSHAFLQRISSRMTKTFEDIVKEAQAIKNDADRAFVLFEIGLLLPGKKSGMSEKLFKDAISIVDFIPSVYDKALRYQSFAEELSHRDQLKSRTCINKIMQIGIPSDDKTFQDIQKSLVDIAYRIDPNYASMVASMVDDDPARIVHRKAMENKVKELELKNEIVNEKLSVNKHINKEYPRIAWQLLGTLNSKRIEAKKFEKFTDMIEKCCTLPTTESYPVFALAIENSISRYEKTPQAIDFLKPLFEGALFGAEISLAIITNSISQQKKILTCEKLQIQNDQLFIKAGEREKGFDYIKNWIAMSASEYIKICDPYFGPEDLEILKLILSSNSSLSVNILTSRKYQKTLNIPEPLEDTYRLYWKSNITEQNPPPTEILVVGKESSGDTPIHDRWIVSKNSGLRLGTSLNSLGISKDTEISFLNRGEVETIQNKLEPYFLRMRRQHSGERLLYTLFSL